MERESHQERKTEQEKIETIAGAAEEMLNKLRNSESRKTRDYENESISMLITEKQKAGKYTRENAVHQCEGYIHSSTEKFPAEIICTTSMRWLKGLSCG